MRPLRLAGVAADGGQRPGDDLQLRRQPLPPGAGVRLPLPIGLIELEEGTRLVADLVGSDPSACAIGMPGRGRVHGPRPGPHAARVPSAGGAERGLLLQRRAGRRARERGRRRSSTARLTVERVKAVERSDERFDRALWAQLAEANLLGLCLPEDDGGSGLGVPSCAWCSSSRGGVVAPVPLLGDGRVRRARRSPSSARRPCGRVAARRRERGRRAHRRARRGRRERSDAPGGDGDGPTAAAWRLTATKVASRPRTSRPASSCPRATADGGRRVPRRPARPRGRHRAGRDHEP